MTLIKKTTASAALVALTSGLFVNGASADSASEIQAAEKLAAAGIVVKQSNTADYQLGRQVLRQEIAAVARGIAKVEKTSTCTNVFKDVSATKPNTWACYTVEALANAGLIAKNANFRPEANITKAEAVGMIVKARYGNEYNPVSGAGEWQKQVVDFAVSKGIASQFTNYNTPATRGFVFEVAAKTLPEESDKLLCELFGTCEDNKKPEVKNPENNIIRNDSNLVVSLSPLSPSNWVIAAKSDRAVLLAFDVTAGKEDVTLKKASLKFTGTGDYNTLKKISIYSNNVKLTRNNWTFNNRLVSELSFDRDVVVKAGETKTLYVTAFVEPKDNTTYNQMIRVDLTNLDASTTVTGAELKGASLTPYLVSNKAEIDVETTSASGRMWIWQEAPIYNFSIRERQKREDVVLKSFSIEETSNSKADIENIRNLKLLANNKEVNADFSYQKNKVTVSLNETIKAWEKVNFSLRWEATDDLTKKLEVIISDVYVVWSISEIALDSTIKGSTVVSEKSIDGTAVNFTFPRNDFNELSLNSTNTKVGDIIFVNSSDYNSNIDIEVTWDNVKELITSLELDGYKVDFDEKESTNDKLVYNFKNIPLVKWTNKLKLISDISSSYSKDTLLKKKAKQLGKQVSDLSDKEKEDALLITPNNSRISFKVKVSQLEDETLGDKISWNDLRKVLNNVELTKNLTLKSSGLLLRMDKANNTKVVPRGNQEVVLYKGKIDLSWSENITLENLEFGLSSDKIKDSEWKALSAELKDTNLIDLISWVKLNIGGKTFNWDVNSETINFSSIYAEIEKNSKGVEMLLTATLKDQDVKEKGFQFSIVPEKISASSNTSRWNRADIASKTPSTTLKIVKSSTITASNISNQLEDFVLAGQKNVEVSAFKISDTNSEIYFNRLTTKFNNAGFVSSLWNVRLMDGSELISDNYRVEGDRIVFENFTLKQSAKSRTLKLVADLSNLTTTGWDRVPFIGKVKMTEVSTYTEDQDSDTKLAWFKETDSEEISVVPAKATYSVVKNFWANNPEAIIKVSIDNWDNDISKLTLKEIELRELAKEDITLVINDKEIDSSTELNALNEELTNLSSFDIKITQKAVKLNGSGTNAVPVTVSLNKLKFGFETTTDISLDPKEFTTVNKSSTTLWVYSVSK